MPEQYTAQQLQGSEYGGVDDAPATVQPKPALAVSPGEKLRLGYLTGDETNKPTSIEDHRQFWGLLPADNRRPYWIDSNGKPSEAEIREVGERG